MDTVKAFEAEKASAASETVNEDTVKELNQSIEEERAENQRLLNEINKLKEQLDNKSEVSGDEDGVDIVEQMKPNLFGQNVVFMQSAVQQDPSKSSAAKNEDPDIVSEASAKVSSIIKMAQQRAEQYINEAKEESERQIRECNQMKAETLDKCRTLEKEKQRACESMIANVKQETDVVLNELYKRTRGISRSQDSLYQELLEKIIGLDVF